MIDRIAFFNGLMLNKSVLSKKAFRLVVLQFFFFVKC